MRLAQAAKKFNVGTSTLVEYLAKKGYEVDNRPTTKLDSNMMSILSKEYQGEARLKERADQIDIGSARRKATEKKKEDEKPTPPTPVKAEEPVKEKPQPKPKEEVKPKVEEKKPEPPKKEKEPEKITAKVQGPKVLDKIDLDQFKKKSSKSSAKEEKKEKPVAKKEAPKPTPPVKKKEVKKKPEPVVEKVEIEKPKLSGPKVLDKINLDEFKTKKKTEQKKKEKPAKKEQQPVAKKEVAKPTSKKEEVKSVEKSQTPAPQKAEEKPAEPETKKIETQFKALSGPKVLGKIELPVDKAKEKKRKRKRIVKKVDDKGQGGQAKTGTGQKTGTGNRQGGGNRSGGNRHGGNRQGGGRGRGNNRNQRGRKKEETPETVSQQEIQDKIKATMARMQGQKASSKGDRSKYKRQKRKEHAEAREEAELMAQEDNTLTVSEFIPLNELASLMDVAPTQLITACFSLGMMVTINQRLDAEIIQLLGEEFGFNIEFASATDEIDIEFDDEDAPEDLEDRNPIVTVMGHVDHGKTSLLDYVRSANVIAGEAGGITQHIGAYEVKLENGKRITFLDTPGHEAFTAMRARGAKVTDIAIIVIAADDSVMPQTREAISHAQAAGVPMIFAFNKMDKPGANADKIREELSQMNILVEDWGGEYQAQEISAKHGTNMDELLEKVLLQAELMELKANPNKDAIGTVVEAKLDKGRGYVSSILVQGGTLNIGDFVVAGQYFGKVKAMFNERGNKRETAGPSVPVEILGLSGAPTAGETFRVFTDESAGKDIANRREQILREQGLKARKHITLDEIGRRLALGSFKELNIIIKGDVDGSVEAMADSLQKLSTEEVAVNIIHKGVGQISESDILLASASDAIVIAFQVRPSQQARKLAEKEDIEIRMYSVIYDAIEEIKAAMEGMLEPKVEERIICNIEVKETFKISKVGTIAGCEVQDGKAKRDMKIRLIRDGIVVYSGLLDSLKRYKDDVKEVYAGQECGLNIKNYNDVKVGDIIEGYEEFEIKRTLGDNKSKKKQ